MDICFCKSATSQSECFDSLFLSLQCIAESVKMEVVSVWWTIK